jgi:hypothetical protein
VAYPHSADRWHSISHRRLLVRCSDRLRSVPRSADGNVGVTKHDMCGTLMFTVHELDSQRGAIDLNFVCAFQHG